MIIELLKVIAVRVLHLKKEYWLIPLQAQIILFSSFCYNRLLGWAPRCFLNFRTSAWIFRSHWAALHFRLEKLAFINEFTSVGGLVQIVLKSYWETKSVYLRDTDCKVPWWCQSASKVPNSWKNIWIDSCLRLSMGRITVVSGDFATD